MTHESHSSGYFTSPDGTERMYVVRGEATDEYNWETFNQITLPPVFTVIEPLNVNRKFSPPQIDIRGDRGYSFKQADRSIQYIFEIQSGVPRCVSVTVGSPPGFEEIRASDLRKARIEEALAAYLDYLSGTGHQYPSTPSEARNAGRTLVKRRRALSDAVLEEVAEIYRANINGAPTQAVADHFDIKLRAASHRVSLARDAGKLTETARSGRKPNEPAR